MILRLLVHFEWHRGFGLLPIVKVTRMPRNGDRTTDGGTPGTLRRCPLCQDGFLHVPDDPPTSTWPTGESGGLAFPVDPDPPYRGMHRRNPPEDRP
jgi:hypothetical protein